MQTPWEEANGLQRPLPDDRLVIFRHGQKDPPEVAVSETGGDL